MFLCSEKGAFSCPAASQGAVNHITAHIYLAQPNQQQSVPTDKRINV
jgi:hypothetical protein